MAAMQEFKCPACGGKVEFDSHSQKLKCPYCDTEFDISAVQEEQESAEQMKPDAIEWGQSAGTEWQEGEKEGMRVYSCKSCGGEIVVDSTTSATSCPYCGNPVVMTGQVEGTLRPDIVIPFKYDKKQAKEKLKRFISDRKFVPKNFQTENHLDEIKGVYVPFWLFDADVDADIQYRGTRVRVWQDKKYRYTDTSVYSVRRAGTVAFEHVPVDGSTKMADDLMESLEPFTYEEAVDFQTAYLAGYLAEKYDVDEASSINRANERIKDSTQKAFRSTVTGYSTLTVEHNSIQLNEGKAQYALYPVWLLNTTYEGEKYTFAMNGQTGKFIGNLPVDKGALARYFVLSTVVVTLILFVLALIITFVI